MIKSNKQQPTEENTSIDNTEQKLEKIKEKFNKKLDEYYQRNGHKNSGIQPKYFRKSQKNH